jgi:hypothetical protein
MTTTARPRHAWVHVIDIEDTVTIHLPDEATQRLKPPPRRPRLDDTVEQPAYGVPHTIGIVDGPPAEDEEQRRFNDFYTATLPRGCGARHRSPDQPGLFARLLRWIGGRR